MKEQPAVILSGFADEAANQKTAVQQFAAFAAMGLQYFSLRFIDAGEGIKNVMKLTNKEIQTVRHLMDEYGLNVATIGSPIGKVKLVDDYTFSDTGRPVHNVIESRFRFEDGLIIEHVDHCDARAWGRMALGGVKGWLAGRVRFLRSSKANSLLDKFIAEHTEYH